MNTYLDVTYNSQSLPHPSDAPNNALRNYNQFRPGLKEKTTSCHNSLYTEFESSMLTLLDVFCGITEARRSYSIWSNKDDFGICLILVGMEYQELGHQYVQGSLLAKMVSWWHYNKIVGFAILPILLEWFYFRSLFRDRMIFLLLDCFILVCGIFHFYSFCRFGADDEKD